MDLITSDDVRQIFYYENGNLHWKENRGCRIKKGMKAGSLDRKGYRQVNVNKKVYKLHRLIYLYHHNHIPKILDHIDGDKLNNKIENLRAASPSESQCNRGLQKNNSSGIKGVYWDKNRKKWEAYCQYQRKKKTLGRYNTKEEAELVAKSYRKIMHGEFTNHG